MVNKKITVLAITLIVVILAAAIVVYMLQSSNPNQETSQKVIRQDSLGGSYNAIFNVSGTTEQGFDAGDLIYTKDGIQHIGYYSTYLNGSMAWIKDNTPSNAVFFNWWDYGHAIVALAGRDSVNKNPSQEALKSVVGSVSELDPNSKITDAATAFTATNETFMKETMEKYGATYLFVTFEDVAYKSPWIFNLAGLNFTEYVNVPQKSPMDYSSLGQQTMLYRLYINSNLSQFTQIYSDENVKIYKVN